MRALPLRTFSDSLTASRAEHQNFIKYIFHVRTFQFNVIYRDANTAPRQKKVSSGNLHPNSRKLKRGNNSQVLFRYYKTALLQTLKGQQAFICCKI